MAQNSCSYCETISQYDSGSGDGVQGLNSASSPANGVAVNVADAGIEYEIKPIL
jgi:hypothetical protein